MTDRGRRGRPEHVAPILSELLREIGLQRRLEERALLGAWPRVVGERLARCSRAIDLRDGVLTVEADHSVWRQELTLLAPVIRQRYNELCGPDAVREIRWRGQASRWGRGENRA